MVTQNIEKYGPYGSVKEPNWSVELGKCDYIKEVIISCGYVIDGIGFVVANASGETNPTDWFGGPGGGTVKIALKCNEYITKISGMQGYYDVQYAEAPRELVIASITIHTNLCPSGYGPFGAAKSCIELTSFSTPLLRSDVIVRIYGRYLSRFLASVGVEVRK